MWSGSEYLDTSVLNLTHYFWNNPVTNIVYLLFPLPLIEGYVHIIVEK